MAYAWIHEAGHFVTLLLSGVSLEQMRMVWAKLPLWPIGIDVPSADVPDIVYYAGGFTASIAFLILALIFSQKVTKEKKQEQFLWFFAVALGYSFAGFTEFIVEGFFTEYHGVVLEQVLIHIFIIVFPLLLVSWHFRSKIYGWYKAK